MKKEIGIPRAISYYNYYPFYFGFFKKLGINIIISDKTTTALINGGSRFVAAETCLPVKTYVGHVINLLNKGVTNILVPSFQSCGFKINNCSKIRGLPEIIRNVIDKPFRMIEPTYDITEKINKFDFCKYIANEYEITDTSLIKSAIEAGDEVQSNFEKMTNLGLSYEKALDNAINGIFEKPSLEVVKPISIVIMAHKYNLFDNKISLNLIKKLEKMDVKVYTSLNVSKEDAINSIYKIGEIQYWANELDLTGTASYFMLNKKVDGIIALSAFGCGPDSLMVDEMEYHAKQKNMPMMHLTIDEHTGEAGFCTRLEAFIDMIIRKQRKFLEKTKISINKNKEFKTDKKQILSNTLG